MDFTSDTTNSQDRSSSHLNLEEAVGPPKDRKNANIDDDEKQQLSLLDDEELRALKLQEEKEALLTRRNTLLQEIQSYQNILTKESADKKPKNGDVLQNDITQNFLDLISISSSNSNFVMNDRKQVQSINGLTNLQKELITKYDTLPLLNMNLRLSYLRDHTLSLIHI